MLSICQLLNLTTQLNNTSLAQTVTKQCFMLSVCVCVCVCVKRALALTENALRKRSAGIIFSPLYEEFLGPLLYFALLTYIN